MLLRMLLQYVADDVTRAREGSSRKKNKVYLKNERKTILQRRKYDSEKERVRV